MKSASEWMQLAALLLVGAGFLSFLATQLVKQTRWPSWVKLVLSMVMALLFGVLTAWLNGDVWQIITAWGSLSAAEIFTFGSIIWAASSGWYLLAFRNEVWALRLGEWPSGKA